MVAVVAVVGLVAVVVLVAVVLGVAVVFVVVAGVAVVLVAEVLASTCSSGMLSLICSTSAIAIAFLPRGTFTTSRCSRDLSTVAEHFTSLSTLGRMRR